MNVVVEIPDETMRRAEVALNIHNPALLLLNLLNERLGRGDASPSGAFNLQEVLLAAAELPDLNDEAFDAFERDLNRPLPPSHIECA